MKILHIGKKGNMENYVPMPEAVKAMDIVDMLRGLDNEDYLAKAHDADIIIADAIAKIDADLINGMPNLKMICSEGVAYNSFDVAAATERGVLITNNQGMNADAVAELTIMLMIGMLRDVIRGHGAVLEGRQLAVKEGYMVRGDLRELADLTFGLVGMGDIAKSVVKMLRVFNVKNINYYKRTPLSAEEEAELGVKYMPLDEILGTSDMVSLHVPITPETMRMANADFFGKMRDGSFFVNTSRGELVDNEALVDALASGKLAMAAFDTLDNEPVSAEHFLVNQPAEIQEKMIFTPHIAGITASSFKRGYEMIWENVLLLSEGKEPKRIVNK